MKDVTDDQYWLMDWSPVKENRTKEGRDKPVTKQKEGWDGIVQRKGVRRLQG
jgi:hypothetical protein